MAICGGSSKVNNANESTYRAMPNIIKKNSINIKERKIKRCIKRK